MPPTILDIVIHSPEPRQRQNPSSPAALVSHRPETPNPRTQSESSSQRLRRHYMYSHGLHHIHSLLEDRLNPPPEYVPPPSPTNEDELPAYPGPPLRKPLTLMNEIRSMPRSPPGEHDSRNPLMDSAPPREPNRAYLWPVHNNGLYRSFPAQTSPNAQSGRTISGEAGSRSADDEDDEDEFVVRDISELGLRMANFVLDDNDEESTARSR
ncbi:hypothetical protein BT96DRAFT_913070 [Gymnopus androsaceus JB14]|uniref:Uncharacterized protein n=1 Tax=Gymnopus androsaceus JB14 TaxID=1447944 RepID=A0A6A4IKQ8_9AGAR|nr:hypothetical protein BT96DRAFT_913070 [Gymnopus androsaceus JB14]